MSAVAKPMTLAEFLVWEERQELKYEFDGFRPIAMTGGTAAHSFIQVNLLGLLYNRLRGHRCRAIGSELKIEVAGRVRYPDAFIVCSPVADRVTLVGEPVVVYEILSEGTSYQDRFEKNWEYRDTPSIRRYVILEQVRPGATVFSRERSDWVGRLVAGDAEIELPEVGISLPMAEIYEGLTFAADGDDTDNG
jgi:Uma2 family endonuclease